MSKAVPWAEAIGDLIIGSIPEQHVAAIMRAVHAAVAQARKDAIEEAAGWHDARSNASRLEARQMTWGGQIQAATERDRIADEHQSYAAAIRALA